MTEDERRTFVREVMEEVFADVGFPESADGPTTGDHVAQLGHM